MATSLSMLVDDENAPASQQEPDTPDDSSQTDTAIIANQAKKIFCKRHPFRRRCDTYFYTIVLGGNTQAIQNVVDYMEDNGMTDVLNWLLRRMKTNPTKYETPCFVNAKRCVIFFLLMLLNIITTPVFYVIHTFTYALLNRQEKRISKNLHLPLAYAMLSQKEDMCMYFLSLGVSFMDSDSEDNNLFDYMADISAESPDRALAMFKMLVKFIKDVDSVKALVLDKANAAGLSALEYVVKYGSPALMTEMLQFPNLLRHSVLAVTDNSLTFNVKKEPSKEKNRLSDTSIDHVDVSRYECGSLVHQSSLLNHLSDRSLMMMSPVDLKLFHSTALVGKWMSMKVKQMVAGVVSLHVLDVVFTCFLLLFSLYYPSPNMLLYNRSLGLEDDVFMYEVKSLSENNSFIFKSETYPKVLDYIRHNYQGQIINRLDRGMVALLFEKTSSLHPQFGTDWRMKYEGLSYIEAENFPPPSPGCHCRNGTQHG